MNEKEPNLAKDAVFQLSECLPEATPLVRGYDWNRGINYGELFESYKFAGFQATNFGKAVEEINQMLDARDVPLEESELDEYEDDEFMRRENSCTIFFGYSANIVSSGLRETLKFLAQNKLIDCIVTSAAGVEEDLIKCLPTSCDGSFELSDKKLPFERIDQHFVPNKIHCLEKWLTPLLDEMIVDQKEKEILWTPSKVIQRLGLRINNEDSIYYWAAVNKIPVFCPDFTDGSLADIFYFHSLRSPSEKNLIIDILDDLRRINNMAMKAKQSGIISVGEGIMKHHMCKANCIRDGADYAVYLNSAVEFDGSDTGAEPDESVACGKIKPEATPVKIHGEATLIFPLLVGETFAKRVNKKHTS